MFIFRYMLSYLSRVSDELLTHYRSLSLHLVTTVMADLVNHVSSFYFEVNKV